MEDADLGKGAEVDEVVHRLPVDQLHQDRDFGSRPTLRSDLLDAQDPTDRGMGELLRDLDFVLGLDQEAIILVTLFE